MSVTNIRMSDKLLQTCPICLEEQPRSIHGLYRDAEDENKIRVDYDRGYAFCNCHNIWFTNWQNMDSGIYNADYEEKYVNETLKSYSQSYADKYFNIFKSINPDIHTFLDVGCASPYMLEMADKMGFKPTGVDVIPHNFEYETIEDNYEGYAKFTNDSYDIIWASHVFEHFYEPILALEHTFELLNDGGLLFVAMPDPFAIDWTNPYSWQHWWIKEHHILWDMESFCKVAEKVGFTTRLKYRNIGNEFICSGDYHLIFQKEKPNE